MMNNLSTLGIARNTTFAVAVLLSVVTGCTKGQPALMPSTNANSVPSAGVNQYTFAVLRIDLKQSSVEDLFTALETGLNKIATAKPYAKPDEIARRKLVMLSDGLKRIGASSIVVCIPGDESAIYDLGIYITATSGLDPELIEDEFIRAGGLSCMPVADNLQVTTIGDGWYFVGFTGDGWIEGASETRARGFSKALENCADLPLSLAVLTDSPETASLDQKNSEKQGSIESKLDNLPQFNGRLARRLNALGASLSNLKSIAGGVGSNKAVLEFSFQDDKSALEFETAVNRIKKDVTLAQQGSLESGEISKSDDKIINNIIATLVVGRTGSHVRLLDVTIR